AFFANRSNDTWNLRNKVNRFFFFCYWSYLSKHSCSASTSGVTRCWRAASLEELGCVVRSLAVAVAVAGRIRKAAGISITSRVGNPSRSTLLTRNICLQAVLLRLKSGHAQSIMMPSTIVTMYLALGSVKDCTMTLSALFSRIIADACSPARDETT
ncbi:hypothetical protein BC940DRAFT_357509, partial [Gongronella butleri]